MKLNCFFITIIFMTIAIPLNSHADDSIFVGGVTLKTGMDRNYVMSELAKYNNLHKMGEHDSWEIYSKTNNQLVGSVQFQKEKASSICKDWGLFYNKDALELGETLHAILSKFEKEGVNIIRFRTTTTKEPNISFQTVEFRIGKKNIIVQIVDDKIYGKRKQIALQEYLEDAP